MTLKPCFGLLACVLLAACASSATSAQWAPRTDASLAVDHQACTKQAEEADQQSLAAYSNGSAGASAAAAAYLDRSDVRGGREAMFTAVRDGCMTKKGWTPAK